MKQKIIIALILNLGLLFYSSIILITKGITPNALNWKFYASSMAVLGFGIFVFLLLRELSKLK